MSRARSVDGTVTDAKQVLWYLHKVPLLAGLPEDRLAALATTVDVREFPRRHVVYLPGDPGDLVFFVIGGRVKRSKVTRDGKELTLAQLGPGEVFGELCLIDGAPRDEMAEATKDTIVMTMPRGVLRELLLSDARLSFELAGLLIEGRRRLEAKCEPLVFRGVRGRLAGLLLELVDDYGITSEDGVEIALRITHQELANLIGSTRETVSLTLAEFKREGLVDQVGRRVVVKDREALGGMD